MTYCVGLLVRQGLAMLADTRTNAGVDSVSTYRKLRIYGNDGRRLITVASAGSLSTTQQAMERVNLGFVAPDTGELESLDSVASIHRAAYLVGQAVRFTRDEMEGLKQGDINFDATLLVGGSVGGEPTRLFLVYSAGNFIECGPDTPYLQIGETKYGKPIIDRVIRRDSTLIDAIKCVLVSFDSTMRSNISVGLPIDIVVYERDSLKIKVQRRIDDSDAYFQMIHAQWGEGLRRVFGQLPDPDWA